MSINVSVKNHRAHDDNFGKRRDLTVFASGKEVHCPQPIRRTEERKDERLLTSPQIKEPTSHSRTWLVKSFENVVLAPAFQKLTVSRLETEEQNLPPLVYVEPAQIPIEGIFSSADTLSS